MKYLSAILFTLFIATLADAQVLPSVKKAQSTQSAWEKAKKDAVDAVARASQLEKDCKADWTIAQKELKALKDQYDASMKAIESGQPKKASVDPASPPKEGPIMSKDVPAKEPGFSSSIPMVAVAKPGPDEKIPPPPFTFKDKEKDVAPMQPAPSAALGEGIVTPWNEGEKGSALISVTMPAGSRIWINDKEIKTQGPWPSHGLAEKTTYIYALKVQTKTDKGVKEQMRKIKVKAGHMTSVLFE